MSRWLVEIQFARPPSFTCDVDAANGDAAIIRGIMKAADSGLIGRVKHSKATLIEETTDDSRRTSEPA